MAVSGLETLTYGELESIKANMDSIASNMQEELNESKRIIEECENQGIFVTDVGSVSMQEQYAALAQSFDPFIEQLRSYSNFLQQLIQMYRETDSTISTDWNSISDTVGPVSN